MRLLVDEDIASDELMARLTKAGHHVETLQKGTLDPAVWQHAQATALTVLTGNADDFIALAERSATQHGLLVIHGERGPAQQMRAAAIAEAIEHVREVYGDTLAGVRLNLNEWRRPRTP